MNNRFERINLIEQKTLPSEYHCNCRFCRKFLGLLIRKDGTYYSKTDRNKYYSVKDIKHIAKTPLHMARFCIQRFSSPGDWVLDPTMGAGTTAVEALNLGRNVVGIELQYAKVVMANIKINNPHAMTSLIVEGDARKIKGSLPDKLMFDLIVNNPPYSGDEQQVGDFKKGQMRKLEYDKNLPNLAFLKDEEEYYHEIYSIYFESYMKLKKGGYFCIGVKDMIRNQKPYLLHKKLGSILEDFMHFEGMVLLPHYPPTLFMSTYGKRFPDVKVPRYQTILIFKKV